MVPLDDFPVCNNTDVELRRTKPSCPARTRHLVKELPGDITASQEHRGVFSLTLLTTS